MSQMSRPVPQRSERESSRREMRGFRAKQSVARLAGNARHRTKAGFSAPLDPAGRSSLITPQRVA